MSILIYKTLPSGIIIENRPGSDCLECWFIKDTFKFHNEDAPAISHFDGVRSWYQHDERHRLDGAAFTSSAYNKYYINGIEFSEEEYWNQPAVKEYMYLQKHPELEGFI